MIAVGCSADDAPEEHVGTTSVQQPLVWGQVGRIEPSSAPGSLSGAIAASGTTLLAGGYGSAYAFVRSGNTWPQQAELIGPASASGFGQGLDVEGNFAIIGAPGEAAGTTTSAGAAYPFTRSGTTWTPEAKLLPNGGSLQYGRFGTVVSISGNSAIIAGGDGGASRAYVYVRGATSWTWQATLTPSDGWSNDRFGSSVSINGDTAVVGAIVGPQSPITGGAVYVYTRSGTAWTQARRINVSGASSFGSAVDLTSTHLLVGATGNNNYRGAAYLFAVGTWAQVATMSAPDAVDSAWFGDKVAFDGTRALIAAPFVDAGGAYVFSGSGFPFEQKLIPTDFTYWGRSVALANNTAYVSANGRVYAFDLFDPIACTSGSQCTTGFCANGVCCDRACNGSCDIGCRTTVGATRDGICAVRAQYSAGSPSCSPYLCAYNGGACPTTCTSNSGCASGFYCSSGACVAKLASGAACTSAVECASNFCRDGKCCSASCTGLCMACDQARTGQPDGTCAGVTAGTDPDNECKDSGAATCQNNGMCDGAGACQKYPAATGCTPQACTTGAECVSTFCADGICCDAACTGACMACTNALKASGGDGVCGPAADGTDPHDRCPVGAGFPQSCLSDGLCNASGACRAVAPVTTSCGPTVCSGNLVVGEVCNGGGQCLNSTGQSCAPFVCRDGACATTCSSGGDCTADAYCSTAGSCAVKKVTGESCAAGVECQSGFCVDEVCCTTPCTGQCEACNVAPNLGSCVPVSGQPQGSRPACANPGTECGGSCNGVDASACKYPGTTTSCGASECVDGAAQAYACDGSGACVPENPVGCTPYACSNGECTTRCTSSTDCAAGFVCDTAGACVLSKNACSEDGGQVVDATGAVVKDCAPYRCLSAQCENSCTATADCVSGYFCRIESGQGTCVLNDPAQTGEDDGGCGCRMPASKQSPASLLVLVIPALAIARRRRASRRCGRVRAARQRRPAASAPGA